MKVVLDTNVLVSAVISPQGTCAKILRMVLHGVVETVLDVRIFREYRRVLQREEFNITPAVRDMLLENMYSLSETVSPLPSGVSLPDDDDVIFYEAALAGSAAYLITGNKKHFPKTKCRNVSVVSPREFLDSL